MNWRSSSGSGGSAAARQSVPEMRASGLSRRSSPQQLAPVVQQIGGAAGVSVRGAGVGERPEPRAQVAGEPDDEPIELFLDPIRLDHFLELLQLDAVRRPGMERPAPQVDGDGVAAHDRWKEEEVAAVEFELEPVHLQPRAGGNPAGWLGLGFAQLGVDRRRTETGVVVVLRSGAGAGAERQDGQNSAGPPGSRAHQNGAEGGI